MQKNLLHRHLGAWALTLIFATAWSLKTMHGLLAHHQHADHPVCEAAHGGNGVHWHDERYSPDDCSLCAFVMAAPAMLSILALPVLPPKLPDSESPNFYQPPAQSNTACDSTLRRGPPVI